MRRIVTWGGFLLLAALLAMVTGFELLLPRPAAGSVVTMVGQLSDGVELYLAPGRATHRPARHLIFVALDARIQMPFKKVMQLAYTSAAPVRLEDIAWWDDSPAVASLYDQIIRITPDHFTKDNLEAALGFMEAMGEPYDLALLIHGAPNLLATTPKSPLISYQDIDGWHLPNLRLVMLQSCYGSSLQKDWTQAGAKAVLSFEKETQNFFYFGLYLRELAQTSDEIAESYQRLNEHLSERYRSRPLYAGTMVVMGVGREGFLDQSSVPELWLAPSLARQ